MPRVTTHTARPSKYDRICTGCGQPIEPGQRYYHWTRRVGPKRGSFRHVECGPPRPTELTSRKTAQVDEAIGSFSAPEVDFAVLDGVDEDNPPESVTLDAAPFEEAVEDVAGTAESVADEYEESADNMPEALQYGAQAEAMRDVAERLRDWAGNLRDVASDAITVDLPTDTDPDITWRAEAEEAVMAAWDDVVSNVESAMEDVPEYEG
jgi:hypothetical protein